MYTEKMSMRRDIFIFLIFDFRIWTLLKRFQLPTF